MTSDCFVHLPSSTMAGQQAVSTTCMRLYTKLSRAYNHLFVQTNQIYPITFNNLLKNPFHSRLSHCIQYPIYTIHLTPIYLFTPGSIYVDIPPTYSITSNNLFVHLTQDEIIKSKRQQQQRHICQSHSNLSHYMQKPLYPYHSNLSNYIQQALSPSHSNLSNYIQHALCSSHSNLLHYIKQALCSPHSNLAHYIQQALSPSHSNLSPIYTTKIYGFVCPPKYLRNPCRQTNETRTSSTYCLDNDKTHFKNIFTVHFINFI